MTGQDIYVAFGNIDRKYVLEAAPDRRKKRTLPPAAVRALVAACLCLILCGSVIAGILSSNYVPTVNGAMFSAEEIAEIIKRDVDSTNAYRKVSVNSPEELSLHAIPDTEYLSIYDTKLAELDEDELSDLVEYIIPKLEELLELDLMLEDDTVADYGQITAQDHHSLFIEFSSSKEIKYRSSKIKIEQRKDYYKITLSYSSNRESLKFNGEDLTLGVSMEEEALPASLWDFKDTVCELFGIDLPYSHYDNRGMHFYNGITHPSENYSDEYQSEYKYDNHLRLFGNGSKRYSFNAHLTIYRKDIEDLCPEIAKAKMISLEEAEAMLANGYVFGGHSCSYCMEAQDKVDFSNYDHVSLEYVFGNNYSHDTLGVPFYVFYKLIEVNESGTYYTYAKTYVPAVKVSGLDEYFEMQKEKHLESSEYH